MLGVAIQLSAQFQVVVDYPLKHMTSENKEAAQKAISRISVGGGTNLSGGLFKGIDQHQQEATSATPRDAPQSANTPGKLTSAPSAVPCTQSKQRFHVHQLASAGKTALALIHSAHDSACLPLLQLAGQALLHGDCTIMYAFQHALGPNQLLSKLS